MIQIINTEISKNTNRKIIDNLFKVSNWGFGADKILNTNINIKDSGFHFNSLNFKHDILNTYADIIFDLVENNTFMKFKKIDRIHWNWYHPGSDMKFHEDDFQDNKFSIIYNLHNNDGGTEFKINNEIKFYKSEESTALLFPSKIEHRGIAPKKDLNRFALNIVLEI
jgi:hypothetical protein